MLFKITWNQGLISIFKYGSSITYYQEGQVDFKNELLSPGAEIVSWSSAISYSESKSVLQLPLLRRANRYTLSFSGTVYPKDTLLVKIEFLNRVSETVGQVFFSSNKGEFIYPKEAYSYKISLLSTGLSHLYFDYLIIADITV